MMTSAAAAADSLQRPTLHWHVSLGSLQPTSTCSSCLFLFYYGISVLIFKIQPFVSRENLNFVIFVCRCFYSFLFRVFTLYSGPLNFRRAMCATTNQL